jgi:hypothetical protein
VIEVEMREDDVAHVSGREPERLDLPHRRELDAKVRIEEPEKEPAEPLGGCGDIAEPVPGIDEHEPDIGLHEHAPACELAAKARRAAVHQAAPERARGDAVEMMNSHARSASKTRAGEAAARADVIAWQLLTMVRGMQPERS